MNVLNLKKGLPSHNEAEQCALGAVLLEPALAIPHVLGYLTSEDFYQPAHKAIFEAMLATHRAGVAIDPITLCDTLKNKDLQSVGGFSYIGWLSEAIPTAANVKYYAKILRRETERRKTILKCADDIESAYVDKSLPSKGFTKLATVLEDVLADAYTAGTDGRYAGYATGFEGLDEYFSGLHPGELYIVAGRPSMGKSALTAQIADNIYGMGGRVAFFPIEVGLKGFARNIASMHTSTDTWKLRGGKGHHQSEAEQTSLLAYLELQRKGVFVTSIAKTPRGVETVLRDMISEHGGLDAVFIDHLQEMCLDKQSGRDTRHYEIEHILAEIRRMAREFTVPIVLAAQVGRSSEGREPTIAEIKDSGSIEQIADVVLIIHGERGTGSRTLNVAKHRNGQTGKITLWLQGEHLRFSERG